MSRIGILVLLTLAACTPTAPPVSVTQATLEDPDALCNATARVFERRRWVVAANSCDSDARTVESGPMSLRREHEDDPVPTGTPKGESPPPTPTEAPNAGATSRGAFRVTIANGGIIVVVACSRQGSAGKFEDSTCPPDVDETKKKLASDIIAESRSAAAKPRDPVPAASAPAASGCSKDTDCKGNRICSSGACVDPAPTAPDPPPP